MFKRILFGALLAAAPAVASATPVQIGNLVENEALVFQMRCSSDSSWQQFRLESLQYKSFSWGDWENQCADDSYVFSIATANSDGSTATKTLNLKANNSYAIVKSGSTGEFTAYDTNDMIVIVNTSSKPLNYSAGCAGSALTSHTVAAKDFTWTEQDPTSCTYQFSIATSESDGTTTSISRNLSFGQIYSLQYNDQRQAWDITEAKQGS